MAKHDRIAAGPGDLKFTQCIYCLHRRVGDFTPEGRSICAAFPDGVPDAIINNEHDHTKPYPGDHGIQFLAN